MTSTPEGAWRVLVHADGSVYHAVRTEGVVADAKGSQRCEVVLFSTPDGRRVGSVHLAPGGAMEALSDRDLLELLEEVRGH